MNWWLPHRECPATWKNFAMATQLTKLMRRLKVDGVSPTFSVHEHNNEYVATVPTSYGLVWRTAESPETAISAAIEAVILARKIPHVST